LRRDEKGDVENDQTPTNSHNFEKRESPTSLREGGDPKSGIRESHS
jgi:hypothetical protein